MPNLFNPAQRSALEELETVVAQRLASGKLSLLCAQGVTQALAERVRMQVEAAVYDDAAAQLGIEDGEDEDNAGEGWKAGVR